MIFDLSLIVVTIVLLVILVEGAYRLGYEDAQDVLGDIEASRLARYQAMTDDDR